MKKLLLLITALLALIPPLHAQVEMPFFLATDKGTTNTQAPQLKFTSATVTTRTNLTSTNPKLDSSTNRVDIKTLYRTTSDYKDGILLDSEGTTMRIQGSGRYLGFVSGSRLKFSMDYGVIEYIDITFSAATGHTNLNGSENSTESTISSSTYQYRYTPIDNTKPLILSAKGTGTIAEIKVTCKSGPSEPPTKPELLVEDGYYYNYDKASNRLGLTCLPGTSCVKVPLPENATDIYYTFNADIDVPASLTETSELSWETDTKWVKYKDENSTSGYISFGAYQPQDIQDFANKKFKLRVIAYGGGQFSEELSTDCYFTHLPAPEVDVERTEAVAGKGQKYDAATNTLTYTGGNPEIYLKKVVNTISPLIYSRYAVNTDPIEDGTNINTSDGSYQITVKNWDGNTNDYPEAGRRDKVKFVARSWFNNIPTEQGVFDEYFVNHNSQPFTITLLRVAPTAPGAPKVEGYTVDGGTSHSWDDPKTLRITDKVELNLTPESGATVYSAVFDHEPTSDELADNTAFTAASAALSVTKANDIKVADGKTECWVAIKNQNESGYSQPTVIHIALQGPAEPALEMLYGYMQGTSAREYTILPSTLAYRVNVEDGVEAVEYQFIQKDKNPTVPDPAKWETWSMSKGEIFDPSVVTDDGRLFIRAVSSLQENAAAKVRSDYVSYDFTMLRPVHTTLDQKGSWDTGMLGEGQLVVIDEPLRVMGFYGTNAVNNPNYMYLMNQEGKVLKVSGIVTSKGDWSTDIRSLAYKDLLSTVYVMPKGGVVGRIHFNDDKDAPELQASQGVTYESENLIPFFGVPQPDDTWTLSDAGNKLHELENRKKINRAEDFGRYVELRSLRYLGGNEFEMADGSRLLRYRRLTVDVDETTELVQDKLYRVKGFIGLAETTLSIFPIAPVEQCPGTPNLYAPNPIKPGVNDTDAEGRITVQAVSDEVEIRVVGNAKGESTFFYTRSDRESDGMISVDISSNKFRLYLSEGADINVDVYAELNGMKSLEPARIRVVKKESVKVESIHDFKTREFASPSTSTIYQLDKEKGQVIIEEITDRYLYVRDYTDEPVQQLADDEHMNRLLILNINGWEATVADANDENAEPRKLQKGDVITNFAIVPTHDRGNLMSNATGFARTFRLVGHDKDAIGSVMPIELDQITDFEFTPEHRMRFVELKGAKVHRVENNGDNKDLYPYNYTITNIEGQPTMRMDVFVRSGFAEAYSDADDVRFNLTGIVMLDNDDNDINDASKFAFALQSFTGSGKLATPQVFMSGSADNGKEDISYNKPGTIVMTAPTKTADGGVLAEGTEVKLIYALGGIDPLKDIQARHQYQGEDWDESDMALGDGDVEIRVFAAAPGMTPSDVVVRRFKKTSHDVQFILNFLETAKAGEYYRFTGDTRVVAVGGEYLFVAGRVGHYLPIRRTRGWDDLGITPGKMLTNFTVGYTVDEHGNRMATADGFESTFNPTDAAADEKLIPVPDEATALSYENHPRRLVRLKGVKVKAPAVEAAAENGITEWDVIEQGDNETHVMPVGKLGNVKIQDAKDNIETDFVDGESYDIVGFVMLNSARDAQMEIWPVEARHLSRVAEVEVKFGDGTSRQVNSAGEIEAAFDGMTTVEFSCATGGARILYAYGYDNNDLVWYEYQGRPLIVTTNEYIHAKAEADNAVESDHTHIVLKRKDMASDVTFSVDDSTPGKAVVTLKAAAGAKIFWWTTESDEESLYNANDKIELTETDIVYAYATESGKVDGKVCHKLVKVTPETVEPVDPSDPSDPTEPTDPEQPADRVSGRVVFSLDNSEVGKVKVKIAPETMPEGDWDIYYTTDPNVVLTAKTGTRYDGAFEVTESSLVMAILVEHSRPEAEATVCEVYVWVTPSAIGSVGADSIDSVRADGDRIIAPEGSEVYDLNGCRVRPEGLRSGIYIVVVPGQEAIKVKVD